MPDPKKNTAYTFYVSLIESSNRPYFKSDPTIAAGDFQVSTDGSAFTNPATLPVVDPTGSIGVKIVLSAGEMNGDRIMVQGIRVSDGEWDDVLIYIDTTTVTVDEIGVAGAGLTALGDTRVANLDTTISSRATPAQILTTALTEAYATDGVAPTLTQVLFMIWSALGDFSISGTTITCKKLNGTTTSMTFTLDSAANPTSRTRAT